MKNNMKRILIALVLLLGIIGLFASAQAVTIQETTNPNDGYATIESGTIVIGVTKFTPDTIVTGVKAATAGADDMGIYVATNGSREGYTYPNMYYYLEGDWYQYDANGNLTYIEDLGPIDIYYVNNELKEGVTLPTKSETYTVTFVNELENSVQMVEDGKVVTKPENPEKAGYTFTGWYKDGTLFDFSTEITSDTVLVAGWEKNEETKTYTVTFVNGSTVYKTETVEEGKTVEKPTEELTKDGYAFVGWYKDGALFDFSTKITEDITVVAEWKSTIAVVYNQEELENAIKNTDITTIKIAQDFEVDQSIVITRDVTIDGQNKTISKSGTPSYVPNGDNYIFKLGYGSEGTKITVKDLKLTNSMAAIIVGSNVEVTVDNLDVTGNEWGGIEVSRNGSLVVNSITMEDEAYKKPVVWIDTDSKETAKVTYDAAARIEFTEDGKDQYQYYTKFHTVSFDLAGAEGTVADQKIVTGQKATKPEKDPTRNGYLFKGWYLDDKEYSFDEEVTKDLTLTAKWKSTTAVVGSEDELLAAVADTEIATIQLGGSFEVDASVVIGRSVTIDGKNNTITKSGVPSYVPDGDNYIFKLGYGSEETEITVKDLKLTNSMAAIVVGNNVEVTVENLDVTGNVWGGIEVSHNGSLVVNSIKMDDEAYKKPVVWVDTDSKTTASVNYDGTTKIEFTEDDKDQYHYYTQLYTVSFDLAEGEGTIPAQKIVNGKVTKPENDPTRDGYLFKGWYLDDKEYNFEEEVTKDLTLTAKWKSTTAVVDNKDELLAAVADTEIATIQLGGSFEVDASVVIGRSVTIDGQNNTITKSGVPSYVQNGDNYIFKLGYGSEGTEITVKDLKLTNSMAAIIVGSNVEVTVDKLDVTGNVWGGIEVSRNGSLVVSSIIMTDEEYKKPVVWVDTDSKDTAKVEYRGAERVDFTEDDKDQYHYYTKFNTVIFKDGNNTLGTQKVVYKQKATELTDNLTKEHYDFNYWYLESEDKEFDFDTLITDNITLKAKYTPINYTIIFGDSGNTINGNYQQTVEITFDDPKDYTDGGYTYVFEGWKDANGNLYKKGSRVLITGNATYTETWKTQKEATTLEGLNALLQDKDEKLDEIVVAAPITIDSGDPVELDLGQSEKPVVIEETITNNGNLKLKLGDQTVTTDKTIVNNGTLTLEGTTGTIATSEDAGNSVHAVKNTKNATLIVDGGTYDAATHASATVYNAGGTVTIEDGTFRRSNENGSDAYNNGGNSYYLIDNYGEMTINGGDFEFDGTFSSLIHNGYQDYAKQYTQNKLGIENPTMTINGGRFVGGLNTIKNDDGGIMTINNGEFVSYAQQALLNWNVATINGGLFNGAKGNTCIYNSWANDTFDKGQLTITGGTFIAPQGSYAIYQNGANATLTISDGDGTTPLFKDYDSNPLDEGRISNKEFTDNRQ